MYSLQKRMSPVGKCEKSVFWGMGSFHGLTGGTNLHRYKPGFNVTIVYPVRTAASHVAKRGSNPLGDASECKSHIIMMWLFLRSGLRAPVKRNVPFFRHKPL